MRITGNSRLLAAVVKRRLLPVLIAMVMVSGVCMIPQTSYAASQYQGFKITKSTRFYIATSGKVPQGLLNTVKMVDSQFAAAEIPSSNPLTIAYGDASGHQSGDIVVSLVDSKKSKHSTLRPTAMGASRSLRRAQMASYMASIHFCKSS